MSDEKRDEYIISMLEKQIDGLRELAIALECENRTLKFNQRLLFWALSAASFGLIYIAYQ